MWTRSVWICGMFWGYFGDCLAGRLSGHFGSPGGLLWNLIKSRPSRSGRPPVELQQPAKPLLADDLAGTNKPMLVFLSFSRRILFFAFRYSIISCWWRLIHPVCIIISIVWGLNLIYYPITVVYNRKYSITG